MTQQRQQFTFDDLREILINRIGLPAENVVNDPSVSFESMGLDSLAFVEIQLAVQQRYGFTIPDEDAKQIETVGAAIDYTNRRLQEQG
jgi:acyl carrier protein